MQSLSDGDIQGTNEVSMKVIESGEDVNNANVTEIEELLSLNVRSENQDVLERQALKELEIFAEQNGAAKNNVIVEDSCIDESTTAIQATNGVPFLNLEGYIKRQEELKRYLELKRSLQLPAGKQIPLSDYSPPKKRRLEVEHSETTECIRKHSSSNDSKSGSEYVPSDEFDSDNEADSKSDKKNITRNPPVKRVVDDGCAKLYKRRLKQYYKSIEEAQSHDILDAVKINGLKVPAKMWNNLYRYQQDGIEWLWKMHQQKTGGLLGDEMGLGKTVQVIVFLAALEYSKIHSNYIGLGPTIIVVPATVVHQWVKHFHDWAPEFRVAILHSSGSFSGGNKTHLIRDINKNKGILVTTYSGFLRYKGCLCDYLWHYLILDEGHKIRNATAKVSIAIKQIRTPHRLLLSGSPMQNNLQELWSLFDFVEPGMLGTLPTFVEHFNNPIIQGGYTNATPMQEATALSVATALKDIISPHLLRRTKLEVKDDIKLPSKSEQVLFCSLTEEQRNLYKNYLMSEHISLILGRGGKNWFSEKQTRANVLVAITALRKICNHPDLYLSATESNNFTNSHEIVSVENSHGYYRQSGKMIVVAALLKIWKKQNHRVLLFTQSRSMLSVFESFLTQHSYTYLKMDGSTSISARQPLINKFNTDSSYNVFLSTTRVGGLGVNLTGASRVIIYDPDWNPATDSQARERAWRIGQDKQVTVYRLISSGTIEEKMYQRQVWKQLLTNKVLIDPRTQKFFKMSDLHDLFSLPDHIDETNLETANIFKNSRVNMQEKINKKKKKPSKTEASTTFSDEKVKEMKNLAQQIARGLSKATADTSVVKQSPYQKEIEEERFKKLEEKESLKKLTPTELRVLNRKKAEPQTEPPVNKIDDSETQSTFANALSASEKTAKLYSSLKSKKIKVTKISTISKHVGQEKSRKLKKKSKSIVVDNSGEVDGQHVEGLMKTEFKKDKNKHKSSSSTENQDQFVLDTLFTKKGVHSALQHDSVLESGYKESNIKIHYEAQQRTDLALQALRKSRLDAWRW